jgi:hypothetical protein
MPPDRYRRDHVVADRQGQTTGFRRAYHDARSEGWVVNHEKIQRFRREGLPRRSLLVRGGRGASDRTRFKRYIAREVFHALHAPSRTATEVIAPTLGASGIEFRDHGETKAANSPSRAVRRLPGQVVAFKVSHQRIAGAGDAGSDGAHWAAAHR